MDSVSNQLDVEGLKVNKFYRNFWAPLENLESIWAAFLIMSLRWASSNLFACKSRSRSKGRRSCNRKGKIWKNKKISSKIKGGYIPYGHIFTQSSLSPPYLHNDKLNCRFGKKICQTIPLLNKVQVASVGNRCCYVTVDPAMAASQNGACTYQCVTEHMCVITDNIILFHNCPMITDERNEFSVCFLWCSEKFCFFYEGKAVKKNYVKLLSLQLPHIKKQDCSAMCFVQEYTELRRPVSWRRHCRIDH